MAEYHQYCPIARASEILADRWTPLIVREMLMGSRRFNEIRRGLPGISRSLLVSRLRQLEDDGVVERGSGRGSTVKEYVLSEAGDALKDVIEHMGVWGVRWAFGEPKEDELDPAFLLWKIHQRIDRSKLPPRRVVVQFDFCGPKARRLWLVLEPREVSVCLKHPGFDVDLTLRVDTFLLYRVFLGYVNYDVAVCHGKIVVEGSRDIARALPRWIMWSSMARFARERC